MNGMLSCPALPVTKNAPSTNRLSAAPGTMIMVSRRRPTRSTIARPTTCATRYVTPSATLTRSAAVVLKPLSVRIVGA